MFLFFQALGIDPKNVKALYRMGKVIWTFKNSCILQVYGLFEGCKQMNDKREHLFVHWSANLHLSSGKQKAFTASCILHTHNKSLSFAKGTMHSFVVCPKLQNCTFFPYEW